MNIDRKTKDEKEDSWQHHVTDSDLSLKLFTVKQYTSEEKGITNLIVISLWHYLLYVQIYPGGAQGNYSSNSIILAIAPHFILPCDVNDFNAIDIRLTICNHPFISIFSFSIQMTSRWNYVTWNITIDKIMIVIAMTKNTVAITINKNKAPI